MKRNDENERGKGTMNSLCVYVVEQGHLVKSMEAIVWRGEARVYWLGKKSRGIEWCIQIEFIPGGCTIIISIFSVSSACLLLLLLLLATS
jgi:hypothetical protein